MEKVAYKGWPNCYRLANDSIELIVTGDVGPRIIRFGFKRGENEFKEYDSMMGKTGGNEWRIYGGHRLWHAPEAQPRSYFPDNAPVSVEKTRGGLRVVQPTEWTTGIQKEMEIRLAPRGAWVDVIHRLCNTNMWNVELAPWALSVMATGGKAIIPLPPRGSHPKDLPPANTLTLWAYSDMSDARWTWGDKYIMLRQDVKAKLPQKVGVMVPDGWVGYARAGHLFVKAFAYQRGGYYPDLGCSVETFTNHEMLEVETVAPLVWLRPGGVVEHLERWLLFKGVPMPKSDADVDRSVLPKLRAALRS